ncbi:MAG: undecaprenyl-diphosphate phosphatase [Candidatus Omnitrophota bacterium]
MSFFEAGVLGVIQGLTEFLPISSSGHLVLFQHLFGIREPVIAFDVLLHWATLLAVFVYFFSDLAKLVKDFFGFLIEFPKVRRAEPLYEKYPYALVAFMVLVANVPTGIIGILYEEPLEYLFSAPWTLGASWLLMGALLVASRRFQDGTRSLGLMNLQDAFLIGIAQGLAITPGISRSGSTILMAILCGFEKKDAARFSFFLGIPAILGAGLLKMEDGLAILRTDGAVSGIGFLAAAVVGYLSIALLMRLVQKGRFYWFGYYCLALSAFTLVYFGLLGGP